MYFKLCLKESKKNSSKTYFENKLGYYLQIIFEKVLKFNYLGFQK